jgi:K+-sensing histidine kinase KdpD
MDDRQDNQSHFIHVFSTPLTAMCGAIDLLRNPKRTADPVTRELLETLARSCARLNHNIDALLAHSQVRGDMVEIVVPLNMLLGARESPEHRPPSEASLAEPSADMATASFGSPLTAIHRAIDLLRHPHRVADDKVTRALLDILEGSYARLSYAVAVLLENSQIGGDAIKLTVPLHKLGIIDESSVEDYRGLRAQD